MFTPKWMLRAKQVVSPLADFTGGRFRHGATFQRWRPDKSPLQCTFDQLAAALRPDQLAAILNA